MSINSYIKKLVGYLFTIWIIDMANGYVAKFYQRVLAEYILKMLILLLWVDKTLDTIS
jgi:hypothetical protein